MSKIDDAMRKQGFLPASVVVRLLGVSRSTVSRWVSAGEVAGQKHGRTLYLECASLRAKVGPQLALTLGL